MSRASGTFITQWSRLRPTTKRSLPRRCLSIKSRLEALTDRQNRLREEHFARCTKGARFYDMRLIRLHSHTTRRKTSPGLFAVRSEEAAGDALGSHRIELSDSTLTSPAAPFWPDLPPDVHILFAAHLPHQTECTSAAAIPQFVTLPGRIIENGRAGGIKAGAYRKRAAADTTALIVVLGLEDYTIAMRTVIGAEYTLRIIARGFPTL